jgi:glycerophosphoryl diester phosphodiesterase
MFHPYWGNITPTIVQKEHKQGMLVNVWTCNDAEKMFDLINMGVNAIMTDYPDRLKQVIDESASL